MYNCITGFCYTFLSEIYQIICFLVEKLYLYVSSHHKFSFLMDSLKAPTLWPESSKCHEILFCCCSLTQLVFVWLILSLHICQILIKMMLAFQSKQCFQLTYNNPKPLNMPLSLYMTNQCSNLSSCTCTSQLLFSTNTFLFFLFPLLLGKRQQGKDRCQRIKHGSSAQKTVNVFFPFNLESSEMLVLTSVYHGSLPDMNWKKGKQLGTMQCVKLNLYFFYKKIIYKHVFEYIYIYIT